jgi:hypothetical protein
MARPMIRNPKVSAARPTDLLAKARRSVPHPTPEPPGHAAPFRRKGNLEQMPEMRVAPKPETVIGTKIATRIGTKLEGPTTLPVSKTGTKLTTRIGTTPTGPTTTPVSRPAPKLTGRANAMTRGRGLKLGLKKLRPIKPRRGLLPRPPKP